MFFSEVGSKINWLTIDSSFEAFGNFCVWYVHSNIPLYHTQVSYWDANGFGRYRFQILFGAQLEHYILNCALLLHVGSHSNKQYSYTHTQTPIPCNSRGSNNSLCSYSWRGQHKTGPDESDTRDCPTAMNTCNTQPHQRNCWLPWWWSVATRGSHSYGEQLHHQQTHCSLASHSLQLPTQVNNRIHNYTITFPWEIN